MRPPGDGKCRRKQRPAALTTALSQSTVSPAALQLTGPDLAIYARFVASWWLVPAICCAGGRGGRFVDAERALWFIVPSPRLGRGPWPICRGGRRSSG